ncbi:FecR family protein [Pedobacter heparinus]|uniref:FecR family protein n=1 Tax=Pedobacter heparinus TaxID=984 RepID=UPI00292D77BE|nr:FecR domain-containing protein [Pedobacter heparinus]
MKQFETNEELIYALIIDDLDGSITPENKELLEQWRATGPDQEKTYQDFLSVQVSMDKLYHKNGYDPQVSWDSLDSKITRQDNESLPAVKPMRNPGLWYKVAAAVLITCALGYYFIDQSRYVLISTADNAAITRVVLPDGTEVNLNAATKIRYRKNDFEENRKLELLTGEVFIQVTKHTSSQFRVELGDIEAEDIGTSFNVNRNEEKITVVVEEGKVALKHLDLHQEILLTAGKQGVYDTKRKHLLAADNLNVNYKAWLDKDFVFQEIPVSQVAEQLQQAYQFPIDIKGARLKDRKLTARLHYQTLDSALAVISASLQCKVTKEKDTYVLSDN